MAKRCDYKGRKEICLIPGKYPVTKNGKINCGRVRNAVARASAQGVIGRLKKGGLCTYIRKCKIKSKVC